MFRIKLKANPTQQVKLQSATVEIYKTITGDSAYEVWLKQGNKGSTQDFLDSLQGEKGKDGYTPKKGVDYFDGEKGEKGEKGADGYTPQKNVDYFDGKNGADGTDGAEGKSAYEIWLAQGNSGTEADFITSLKGADGKNGADGKDGKDGADGKDADESEIALLKQQVADLMYKPVAVSSFTNSMDKVEKGTVVNEVTLFWKINKTPTALTVDSENIDVSLTEKTLTGLSVTADRTFKLKAVDERGAVAEKSTKITFLNGVYHGVTSASNVDSATLLGLEMDLQDVKRTDFTVNAQQGERIIFALPQSFGQPKFKVNGFEGGFILEKTFSFTNKRGYTENYCVWTSENTGLGATQVNVS